jgi:hypothetical protein
MQNHTRACTKKRAGNVGFRGNSGRGLGIAECPLMTLSGCKRSDDLSNCYALSISSNFKPKTRSDVR